MVYSFDVFDTCLCRLCGEPRLMFDVLSLKVQETMGESCSEQLRQMFVASRAEASGGSLKEIYDNVSQSFPLPNSVEKMAEMEMEVERQMLMPIVETRRLVGQLREKGEIWFISDIYLPSTFIRERLVEHGFFKEGDKLFVSDELHAWKHDGSLFRLIHESEGISYRRWHHYGNNRQSDYREPRGLGIHAHHLTYGYLPYEDQWRRMPVLQYQYPAILAGVARAIRLSIQAPDDQKAFVSNVSAPLMVTWVLHVMNAAQKRGIRRLYFCARDTHTQFLIARQLQSLFSDLSVHYLFISREAVHYAEEDLLFQYFRSCGLASTDNTAIVDSNSTGETLRVLNSMMKKHGCSPVAGFFIVSNAMPEIAELTFPSISPRYISSLGNKKGQLLTGVSVFLEQILSLNYHRKTIGYECHGGRVRPFFGEDLEDDWQIDGMGARQAKRYNDQLAQRFCQAFLTTGLYRYNELLFENVTIPSFTDFVDCPRKEYLEFLNHFVWRKRPFVGSLFGKNKGVWYKGNYFYWLPDFITAPLRAVLSNANRRR